MSKQPIFAMVAFMLMTVLFDRRAISLRSVALLASLLFIFSPEVLFCPSFQMSFVANTALVRLFYGRQRQALKEDRTL